MTVTYRFTEDSVSSYLELLRRGDRRFQSKDLAPRTGSPLRRRLPPDSELDRKLRNQCRLGVGPMETPGHSQISLTMNTYSHVIPALQREVDEKVQAVVETAR